MLVIAYDIDDGEVQAYFDYAGYRARDMRDPLQQVLTHIRTVAGVNFATEGTLSGGWAPLTPKYAAWKARAYGNRPMLVLKAGAPLRRAAISSGRVTRNHLAYHPSARNENGFDYAEPIFMGRGGTNPMLARPWFEDDEQFREFVEHVFYEWLDDLRTRNSRRSGFAVHPPSPAPTFTIG